MGYWRDHRVFYRDFGYPNSRPHLLSSMAYSEHGDIGDTSAKIYAEYVANVRDRRNQ